MGPVVEVEDKGEEGSQLGIEGLSLEEIKTALAKFSKIRKEIYLRRVEEIISRFLEEDLGLLIKIDLKEGNLLAVERLVRLDVLK